MLPATADMGFAIRQRLYANSLAAKVCLYANTALPSMPSRV